MHAPLALAPYRYPIHEHLSKAKIEGLKNHVVGSNKKCSFVKGLILRQTWLHTNLEIPVKKCMHGILAMKVQYQHWQKLLQCDT